MTAAPASYPTVVLSVQERHHVIDDEGVVRLVD